MKYKDVHLQKRIKMATAFLQMLSTIAPEACKIVETMQKEKFTDKQIMIALLGLNLEINKNCQCMMVEIRNVRSDIGDLRQAMLKKGTI